MPAAIRRAVPADADAIAAVLWSSRRSAMPWLTERYTKADMRDWIGHIVLVTSMVWVAVEAGEIVGYSALDGNILDQLYVGPSHQRQGIGTQLLEVARAAAGSPMCVYVFAKNQNARRFYERHGFTMIDESDGSRNQEGEPDVRYEWRRPKNAGRHQRNRSGAEGEIRR
jgi:GNAT superfamily N-acetyltransferase